MNAQKTQQPLPLESWAEFPKLKLSPDQPERMAVREEDLRRFWSKVTKCGSLPDQEKYPNLTSRCWEWTGSMAAGRYGEIRFRGCSVRAHRFSAYLVGMESPQGTDVCHKCDNPSCVNPDHLFVGSRTENMMDAMRKGRLTQAIGFKDRRPSRKSYSSGELHPQSKLTDSQVREIRCSSLGLKVLAERYGVSTHTIWRAKKGKRSTSEIKPHGP